MAPNPKPCGQPQAGPAADTVDGHRGSGTQAWGQPQTPWAYDLPLSTRRLRSHRCQQVWSTDITYCPIRQGLMYLVAVITRRVERQILSRSLASLGMTRMLGTPPSERRHPAGKISLPAGCRRSRLCPTSCRRLEVEGNLLIKKKLLGRGLQ